MNYKKKYLKYKLKYLIKKKYIGGADDQAEAVDPAEAVTRPHTPVTPESKKAQDPPPSPVPTIHNRCPYCQNILFPDSQICTDCGVSNSTAANSAPPPPSLPPGGPTPPSPPVLG